MSIAPTDLIGAVVDRFAPLTDGPEDVCPVAERFARALVASEGQAALEIGVRAGGMSAVFCALAMHLRPPPFMVISVDPWGVCPYRERGRDVSGVLRYGEDYYAVARGVLSPFPNSMLFRLDADTFLDSLLPDLRWWYEHAAFPAAKRFLAFAWLDGRHDDRSVAHEALWLLPRIAPGGTLAIDNVDHCPGAVAFLRELDPALRVEAFAPHRLALTVG